MCSQIFLKAQWNKWQLYIIFTQTYLFCRITDKKEPLKQVKNCQKSQSNCCLLVKWNFRETNGSHKQSYSTYDRESKTKLNVKQALRWLKASWFIIWIIVSTGQIWAWSNLSLDYNFSLFICYEALIFID